MPFVTKLTRPIGNACWLSDPNANGFRVIVIRERAAVFETAEDAQAAIESMPAEIVTSGLVFSVETAD